VDYLHFAQMMLNGGGSTESVYEAGDGRHGMQTR
jgi:hypothetical protein